MARTSVGMIGLDWEEITAFAQKTQKTSEKFGEFQEKLIYYLGAQGGALSKKLANELTAYMKAEIYSQNAFTGMPALSPTWTYMKAQMGLDPRIGIATGDMVNAIKPVNQKYGRWKVGISKKEHSISPGNVKSVAEYAKMLEYGYGSIMGADGKRHHQPPRPFFGTTFMRWAHQNLPKHIAEDLQAKIEPPLKEIYEIVAKYMPHMNPEDYYWISHEEPTSEIQETFQESMEQGGGPTVPLEEETLQTRAPGVTGRPSEGEGEEIYPERDIEIGVRNYPESERISPLVGEGWTEEGDIFNPVDEMWQDWATYTRRMNEIYGSD